MTAPVVLAYLLAAPFLTVAISRRIPRHTPGGQT